ncbi:hypothetical protein R1flu_008289 [Riccia fluitans]|uniref:Reverse transcriptase domain-containing protein n=1 Tax=Riccia fluitans TaxID=41844 RepID=A0ABD1YBA3_9MARC
MTNAKTLVHINGAFTPSFMLQCGVRQGCPLAPMLYALNTIPLMGLLKQAQTQRDFRPIFHDNRVLSDYSFCANDAGVYVDLHEDIVLILLDVLRMFQEETQATRYLGVPIGNKVPNRLKWDTCIQNIAAKLHILIDSTLAFEARVILLRHVFTAMPVFYISVLLLSQQVWKEIVRLFKEFLWGFSPEGRPKLSLVAWRKICLPTTFGGLGIADLPKQSRAFLIKLMGQYLSRQDLTP